jgi:energy-coupling factor transporter ATP-binding protein EcfA2
VFDGKECGFRAESGDQAHVSRWKLAPGQMSQIRDEAMLTRFVDRPGLTIEQQWVQEFSGFVRLYRRRFREILAQEQKRYEVGAEDVAVFLPTKDGTAVELVVREIEDFLFFLAQVREASESLKKEGNTALRLPEIDAWQRYEPLLATSDDSIAETLYPKLCAFYDDYKALSSLLRMQPPPFPFSILRDPRTIPQTNTRLDLLGTLIIWAFEGARRARSSLEAARALQTGLELSVAGPPEPALRIAAVELRNIRCFEHLKLDLASSSKPSDWVLVVGDNARGKSTLLRSIAMGLCNETAAAALLNQIPGRILRGDAREGYIEISLVEHDGKSYAIRTDIKMESDANEVVRRSTSPAQGFPWDRIFVCAYGAQRTRHAQKSYERYAALDAVLSLFDYDADLQNPEVILRRQPPGARVRMERKLRQILMLEGEHGGIDYSDGGIALSGPWGKLFLGALSDGYRSTFQWVLDLIGWLIYAGRFEDDDDVTGIVLIDELEQHLHPRWQRYIISQIHRQFPGIQFVTSTHTPLVAAGIADIDHAMLIALEDDENGATTAYSIDPHTLRGQRADQVLTSRAFGLATSRSPGSTDGIARYAELAAKERTHDEDEEFDDLARTLEASLAFGETPFEQRVEQAVRKTLDDMLLGDAPGKATELEVKKQLRALFRNGESS